MPESDVEQLPQGSTANSFRVLAEWLRDNRRMLEGRLDTQDKKIADNQSIVVAKLEEIHQETRRTNGRVTDIENSAEMGAALADGRQEWEHTRDEAEERKAKQEAEAADRREARREKRVDRLTSFGFVVLGLAGGGLGHAIGIY